MHITPRVTPPPHLPTHLQQRREPPRARAAEALRGVLDEQAGDERRGEGRQQVEVRGGRVRVDDGLERREVRRPAEGVPPGEHLGGEDAEGPPVDRRAVAAAGGAAPPGRGGSHSH